LGILSKKGFTMAMKDVEAAITKAEKALAAELSEDFTKAVRARDVQAKADKETKSTTRTPPKEVAQIFDKALSDAMTKAERQYKGIQYSPKMTFALKGTSWIATVKVDLSFRRKKMGGASHVIKQAQTVWEIAEEYYGIGNYWPALEAANPDMISKGNFIVCSMGIKVPSVEVVAEPDLVPEFRRASAPKEASKPAWVIMMPDFELDVGSKPVTQTVKLPGMTVIITAQFKGKVTAKNDNPLPAGYNIKSHEGEVKAAWKNLEASAKVDVNGPSEIGVSSTLLGGNAKVGYSLGRDGSFKCAVEPKPISVKAGDTTFEGNIGLEISGRLIPDIDAKAPEKVPVGERARAWLNENRQGIKVVIIGVALVATAVVVVKTGGLAAPAAAKWTPALFAAAGPGMRLIVR
jgi:hypothetical protein